jgi:hypothetical protein
VRLPTSHRAPHRRPAAPSRLPVPVLPSFPTRPAALAISARRPRSAAPASAAVVVSERRRHLPQALMSLLETRMQSRLLRMIAAKVAWPWATDKPGGGGICWSSTGSGDDSLRPPAVSNSQSSARLPQSPTLLPREGSSPACAHPH